MGASFGYPEITDAATKADKAFYQNNVEEGFKDVEDLMVVLRKAVA